MTAYWIAHMTVSDPVRYAGYAEAATSCIARHGGRFLARGGRAESLEGGFRPRNVVIAFPSLEAAVACYHSEEYQAARALRVGAGEGEMVIVEALPAASEETEPC